MSLFFVLSPSFHYIPFPLYYKIAYAANNSCEGSKTNNNRHFHKIVFYVVNNLELLMGNQ